MNYLLYLFVMSRITTIIGPLHSGKTARVIRLAIDALNFRKMVSCILPSVHHIRFFKDQILAEVQQTLPGQLFVGTFASLADRILDEAGFVYRQVGNAEDWLNIRTELNDSDCRAGTILFLQKTFAEIRNAGLKSDEHNVLVRSLSEPSLNAWMDLFEKVRQKSRNSRRFNSDEQILCAWETLNNRSDVLNGDLLLIDGFYEFTPIQKKILNRLADRFTQTFVTFPLDKERTVYGYVQNQSELFPDSIKIEMKKEPLESPILESIRTGSFLSHGGVTILEKPASWTNDWKNSDLKVIQCPTRWREVETAARTIKRWICDGMKSENIGIIFRGSYDYSGLITLILPRFGIPVKNPNRRIAQTEPAEFLLRIASVNEKRFIRSEVMDIFRHASVQNRYGKEAINDLERLTAELGIPVDKNEWITQYKNRLDFVRWRATIKSESDEFDRVSQDDLTKKMESRQPVLERFLDDISVPSSATWLEFGESFGKILQKFFPELENRSINDCVKQISALISLMSKIAGEHNQLKLADYSQAMRRFFEAEPVIASDNENQSGLFYSSVMDARGKSFSGLVILGMTDGEFPQVRRDNPILTNEIRRKLNSIAGEVIFSETSFNIDEEKWLFFLAISMAAEKLLLTFPLSGFGGKQLPMSSFLTDLLSALPEERKGFETVPVDEILPKSDAFGSIDDVKAAIFSPNISENDRMMLTEIIGNLDDIRRIGEMITIEKNRQKNIQNEWSGRIADFTQFWDLINDQFSVSRIQEFARCPFYFLCKNVWKIYSPEEPSMDVTPLVDGHLIHSALESLLRTYLSGTKGYVEFLESDSEKLIEEIILRIDHTYRPKFRFLTDIVWQNQMETLESGLQAFVRSERRFSETNYCPVKLEKAFNLKNNAFSVESNGRRKDVIFSGQIDRIDVNPERNSLEVVEYKRTASSAHSMKDGVGKGVYFQLSLYLIAARQLLNMESVTGAYTYVFRDGKRFKPVLTEKMSSRSQVIQNDELESLLEQTLMKIGVLLNKIFQGNFDLLPFDVKRCKSGFCEYFDLCRIRKTVSVEE